jgi:lipopolysaccharide/colanic/teichoic acid biosynthesis glycosyltransferase
MGPRPLFAAKVALEWLVALVGLLVLSPLFLLLALLVKLTSRGPVLYVATRVGRGGRCFPMMKLRSMYVGVAAIVTDDNKVIVEENDPRITPIGKVLRMGFDELPQLINVLRGEMAIIGPRPDVDWMLPQYTDEVRTRLAVRPGITGVAQVLRGRDLTNDQNYQLDVWYVRNWSPWVDLRIALYTLPYSFGARDIGRRWLASVLPEAAALERAQ